MKNLVDAYIAELEGDEVFEWGKDDDGTFLINYKNWRQIYNKFFVAVDFEDHWNAVRFKSMWSKTMGTWGGVPVQKTEQTFKDFAKNP